MGDQTGWAKVGVEGDTITLPFDPTMKVGRRVVFYDGGGAYRGRAVSVYHLILEGPALTQAVVDRWRRVRWYHRLWWWLRDFLFGG